MKMLESFRALIFGPQEEPKTFATATTADDLIAERLITLIKSRFDEWKVEGITEKRLNEFKKKWPRLNYGLVDRTLSRGDVVIAYDYSGERGGRNFHINGIPIDRPLGERILGAYYNIYQLTEEQRREQQRIKREQEILNEKWDLAENVLGLERTALGALQPKGGFTQ